MPVLPAAAEPATEPAMQRLSLRLAHHFSQRSRRRGHTYWRQGRVRIAEASNHQVLGRVRGTRDYNVVLQWEDPDLDCRCECPAFEREGECKHLWAIILEAEDSGLLGSAEPASALRMRRSLPASPSKPRPPSWRQRLQEFTAATPPVAPSPAVWPEGRRLLYALDVPVSLQAGSLVVELCTKDRKRDGSWGALRSLDWARDHISRLPEDDAGIVAALAGARPPGYAGTYQVWNRYDLLPKQVCLSGKLLAMLLPRMVATGRCWLIAATTSEIEARIPSGPRGRPQQKVASHPWSAAAPLVWDDGGAWQFLLEVTRAPVGGWDVRGILGRGSPQLEQMDLQTPVLILAEGFVFTPERVASLAPVASLSVLLHFRRAEPLRVPDRDRDALLATLLEAPALPPLVLPEELRVSEVALSPVPRLAIHAAEERRQGLARLEATLAFDYGNWRVEAASSQPARLETESRSYQRRDPVAEQAAAGQLPALGFRFRAQQYHRPAGWELAPAKLPHAVRALVGAGWQVEAEGRLCRPHGACSLAVSSGVDWFELRGEVAYGEGDAPVRLPALLAALRRGEAMVPLADGSFGMLPEEWLRRFGALAALGEADNDHLRFRASQAGLLDALLATQPAATCDELFARARRELRSFEGIAAVEQPPGLCGHLRDYQREGLGWLLF
ncbi:MAG TPA: hypothetical protein VNF74_07025, partial [Terriglobales bacterium]|nr:hypothetical protein [Terriglobales bacterium]